MLRLLPITALVIAGALTVARADVYRWVDEKGEPHYSDQWVPGSTVIKTSKATRPDSEGTGRSTDQKSLTAMNGRANGQVADQDNARAVQQDVTKTRQAQCKAAQDRYMKAIESRRVYKEGKDGTSEYLSDAEADAYRETARKDVLGSCGSVPTFDPNAPIPEPKPIPDPKVNPADATSE
jgi:hypothetical protein